jgi:hypothetical protein
MVWFSTRLAVEMLTPPATSSCSAGAAPSLGTQRIVSGGRPGETLPVHHRDLDGRQPDRRAVRAGGGDRAVPDHPAATRAVHDVDLRPEPLGELRADEAGDAVGATARGPRDDQLDRSAGEVGGGVARRLGRGLRTGSTATARREHEHQRDGEDDQTLAVGQRHR